MAGERCGGSFLVRVVSRLRSFFPLLKQVVAADFLLCQALVECWNDASMLRPEVDSMT